jgi:hypothetical protein
MERKIIGLALLFVYSFINVSAQDEFQLSSGILRAQGAFAMGRLTESKATQIYIKGDLSYYLDNKISVRADGFYFVDSQDKTNKPFEFSHSLFTGLSYHLGNGGPLDPYIGLQPGINFARIGNSETLLPIHPITPSWSPVVSGHVGLNYYAPKIFHLFVHLQYIQGRFVNAIDTQSLSEFRISFGLGWNIDVVKDN